MRNKKLEIFEWGSLRLRAVEADGCDGCYWYADGSCVSPPEFNRASGGCLSDDSADERDVIFVKETE